MNDEYKKKIALSLSITRVGDLTGQKFGRWTVIERALDKKGRLAWKCKCECGNEAVLTSNVLTHGRSLSCGCSRKEHLANPLIDLTGQRFGRYIVVSLAQKRGEKNYWLCQCDCGNEKEVEGYLLRSGQIKSCGCYNIDSVRKRVGDKNPGFKQHLPEDYRDKHRLETRYGAFVRSILERDDFTCTACGIYGSEMNVHHKNGWHWCKERRLDPSNVVTLCLPCHNDFHKRYGRRKNTEAQFEDWLYYRWMKDYAQ